MARYEGPVDESVPAVAAVPVVIPFGAGEPRSPAELRQFYESLLWRLQQAYAERDLEAMLPLLADYRRPDVPQWVQQRMAGYDALARGLQFERHAATSSRLRIAGDTEAAQDAGEPVAFELVLEPPPGQVRLGSRAGDTCSFLVEVVVTDHFVDGSSRQHEDSSLLRLPAAHDFERGPLVLPLEVAVADAGAVLRVIELRVDLLPGYVQSGDLRVPVRRGRLAGLSHSQWPRGHRPIRAQPMATLCAAMQLGDAEHFPHVRLAAVFMPAAERNRMIEMLIDWVRLGRPDQALVAMATLRAVGAADIAIGDREAWLSWFDR